MVGERSERRDAAAVSGCPLLSVIEDAMSRHPERLAVRDHATAITFAELDLHSAALAARIEEATDSFAPVIIDLPRSARLIVALLAVFRSGRGCVPIDRSQPSRRIDSILADSGSTHVVVVASSARDGDASAAALTVAALPGRRSSGAVAEADRGDELTYVLHTSGSTGEPKGVVMGRGPIARLVAWHLGREGHRDAPITAQFAPITFDVAWQEIFTSLALGGTLEIVPETVRSDPARLLEFCSRAGVTRLFLPTAYLQAVAERGRRGPWKLALEHVFVAGSQLRISPEIRQWFVLLGGCAIHNHYGPTETHVVTSHTLAGSPDSWPALPPIGGPLPHVAVRICDASGRPVPPGEPGELLLGGGCLATGYRNRPDLTAERFFEEGNQRWYRTGDLVRADRSLLSFLGRLDRQLKIDGHRVEPGEAEALLAQHPDVRDAHVTVSVDGRGRARLVAYVVSAAAAEPPQGGDAGLAQRELHPPWRDLLIGRLPAASVPTLWLRVAEIPLTAHGKVDSSRLPAIARVRPPLAASHLPPSTPTEQSVARIWERHLDLDGIGRDDNFFDLGGTSLIAASVVADCAESVALDLPLVTLYANPTIRALAAEFDQACGERGTRPEQPHPDRSRADAREPIAVVGMACRFPGAGDPAEYWRLLIEGRDTITREPGPTADGRIRAAGVIADVDLFDAGFFGVSTAQARLLDPQQRLFLECCVEAMEDAAWAPGHIGRSIGVFAGSGPSTYLLNNLAGELELHTLTSSVDEFTVLMANDKEFLPGRLSYSLDLRGPSVNVNAACATSLFAVHYAIHALRSGSCELALAGAASIQVPQCFGYRYQESMPFSPDGRCRAFDRAAAGTVFGSGVGVLALKRLSDAVAQGDDVYAVVRGSGISNDGADKVGITAPSVSGQERAIRAALEDAGVPAASVRYVEGHGTGTHVGDAIEVEALRRAFGSLPAASCGLGSVKTNLGHLGWAAGMAGLMKAVLALRHRLIPPTLHISEPNPDLELDRTPFFIVDRPIELSRSGASTRVGVSAFGVGGFNAHVVLEEAPERAERATGTRMWHVLPFSARGAQACQRLIDAHARASAAAPVAAADLARTLSLGRTHHGWRRAVVVGSAEPVTAAMGGLAATDGRAIDARDRPSVGIFAGHGAERRGMGEELYEAEPVFRAVLDGFDDQLRSAIGATVAEMLYPPGDRSAPIHDVVQVHAVVFALQLALFRLWESKGIRLEILLGHSLGQYAAACAAGVFSSEDGMRVVLERGRAIEATDAAGTMASVRGSGDTVQRYLEATGLPIDIAVLNSCENTVVSGLEADLRAFAAAVPELEIKMLGSLRAGHSRLMRSAADRLVRAFASIELCRPERRLLCNLSGDEVGDEVTTPAYWGEHLCRTVRFAAMLEHARALGAGAFVEVSGSAGLLALASSVLPDHGGPWIPVLRPRQDACRGLAQALAAAYEAGLNVDWKAVVGVEGRMLHAPTYPFERRRHWIGPGPIWQPGEDAGAGGGGRSLPLHEVCWRPLEIFQPTGEGRPRRVAVLGPGTRWHRRVAAALPGADSVLSTTDAEDPALQAVDDVIAILDHDDLVNAAPDDPVSALRVPVTQILLLVQGLARSCQGPVPRLWLMTQGAQNVEAGDGVVPGQRALLGLGRVLALEHPEFRPVLVDLGRATDDFTPLSACLHSGVPDGELAIRGGRVLSARLVPATAAPGELAVLRADRTYLVVGGLTGLGLWTAETLAQSGARHLLLAGRRAPSPEALRRLADLEVAGCAVATVQLDVCDGPAVDRLFSEYSHHPAPIGGVVHSAGVLDDCLLGNASWEAFEAVLSAKVQGAWNLHRSAERHRAPLAFFALYSSAAAVHGNYGQAAYATANAFLDGLAHYRRGLGLPAVSFDWGVIEGVGRVSEDGSLMAELQRRGFGTVGAAVARAVLLRHLTGASPQVLVLPNDWEAFVEGHNLHDRPFFAELLGPREPARAAMGVGPSLRERLIAAAQSDRAGLLAEHLLHLVGRYLDPDVPLRADQPISEFGLDSLSTIQLRNDLQASLQTPLPVRLLANFPSAAALAQHLIANVVNLSTPVPGRVGDLVGRGTSGDAHVAAPGQPALSLEQRRWLLLTREIGYGKRVVPVIVHDRLERDAFSAALRAVVSRHELLRQIYPGAAAIEVLAPDAAVPAEDDLFADLSHLDQPALAAAVAEALRRTAEGLPDPALRPSWAIRCLDLGRDHFLVIVGGQHLEFDGSGLSVFIDELREAYRSLREHGEVPRLEEPVQYRAYAAEQAVYLARSVEADRSFFRALFASVRTPTRLSGHDGRNVTSAHPSRRYTPPVPLADWRACRGAAQLLQVTPFSLVLAAYAVLLADIVGEPAVTVCMIRSSRYDRRFASTIGPFTMPFPVPVHVGGWPMRELVQQVDDSLAALTARPQYPATDLLTSTRAFAGLPLDTYFSDAGINFVHYRRKEATGRPRVELIEVLGEVTHPLLQCHEFGSLPRVPGLHLVAAVDGDALVGNYWYHTHRFDDVAVASWAVQHRRILSDVVSACASSSASEAAPQGLRYSAKEDRLV